MEQDGNKLLEHIYRETFPKVAAMISGRGGTWNEAKDVFHDALIIYLEKKKNNGLDIQISVSAYLMGIAKNLWVRKWKAETGMLSLEDLNEDVSIPEDFYTVPKQPRSVLNRLAFAGRKCMQLLQAFYYEQLPTEEITRKYNYNSNHSAAVQKHKCLEKIRAHVKQQSELYEEAMV